MPVYSIKSIHTLAIESLSHTVLSIYPFLRIAIYYDAMHLAVQGMGLDKIFRYCTLEKIYVFKGVLKNLHCK